MRKFLLLLTIAASIVSGAVHAQSSDKLMFGGKAGFAKPHGSNNDSGFNISGVLSKQIQSNIYWEAGPQRFCLTLPSLCLFTSQERKDNGGSRKFAVCLRAGRQACRQSATKLRFWQACIPAYHSRCHRANHVRQSTNL